MFNKITLLKKSIIILNELKSDSIKDRHWRLIIKLLNLTIKNKDNITLGIKNFKKKKNNIFY